MTAPCDPYEHTLAVIEAVQRARKSEAYRDGLLDAYRLSGRHDLADAAQRAIDEMNRNAP